jgi:DNA-binding transcriptional ArsR family regulator
MRPNALSLHVIFKTLANAGRRRVFQVICKGSGRAGQGLTVEQICRETGYKQPAVSHHIARLTVAGLITRTRDRYWVHCSPRRKGLDPLRRFLQNPALFPAE